VQWSSAPRGGAVLDVCCGSGDLALRLAEAVGPSGRVTGLDFAAAQLEVAARREGEAGNAATAAPVRWVEGDACALPFEEATFDAATCGYGLRNVVDIPGALAELLRVLRPGATAALLDFNRSESPLAAAAQRAMLDNVVVPVARAAGMAEEYEYLVPSIQRFPTGRQQVALARAAGFARAVHYELAGGLMGVLVATKQA
jgi:demethylmenaquinone methyltransferase/2-methoxy-6-polyprenyl-1,4-benzoquinol methylase